MEQVLHGCAAFATHAVRPAQLAAASGGLDFGYGASTAVAACADCAEPPTVVVAGKPVSAGRAAQQGGGALLQPTGTRTAEAPAAALQAHVARSRGSLAATLRAMASDLDHP